MPIFRKKFMLLSQIIIFFPLSTTYIIANIFSASTKNCEYVPPEPLIMIQYSSSLPRRIAIMGTFISCASI